MKVLAFACSTITTPVLLLVASAVVHSCSPVTVIVEYWLRPIDGGLAVTVSPLYAQETGGELEFCAPFSISEAIPALRPKDKLCVAVDATE